MYFHFQNILLLKLIPQVWLSLRKGELVSTFSEEDYIRIHRVAVGVHTFNPSTPTQRKADLRV